MEHWNNVLLTPGVTGANPDAVTETAKIVHFQHLSVTARSTRQVCALCPSRPHVCNNINIQQQIMGPLQDMLFTMVQC